MRANIFAYTTPGGLSPEYISVKSNSDGGAEITVRSLGGGLASIDLPPDELVALGRSLLAGDHRGSVHLTPYSALVLLR